MNPLIALAGGYLLAEAYTRVVPSTQKRKWENFVRMHHGEAGLIMTALGIASRSPSLAASGIGLTMHDWPDKNKWFNGRLKAL